MRILVMKAFGYRVALFTQEFEEVESRDFGTLTEAYHFIEKHISKLTTCPMSQIQLDNPFLQSKTNISVHALYRSSAVSNVMNDSASKELFVLSRVGSMMEHMFFEKMDSGTVPQHWYFEAGSLAFS